MRLPVAMQKSEIKTHLHHIRSAADALDELQLGILSWIQKIKYGFNDAQAPDRRKSQIFELVSNRAMYQNGWMASSIAYLPWEAHRTGYDPNKAKWELYNLDQDFSQADDLATQNPDKLKMLEDLWWAEAARHDVLPLDWRSVERLSEQLTGRPNLAEGRKTLVYNTPLVALPEGAAPDLKNKSFTITAEVNIPSDGGQGMIFTQGGITVGWGFYIQNRKLVGMHNYIDSERYRIVSTEDVPTGKVSLVFDFNYDGGGMGKGGTITLLANGKKIGTGRVEKTAGFKYSLYEGQDIGEDSGSPVDSTYTPPFMFTGKIEKVTIDLK
jgi:hypothetical protein